VQSTFIPALNTIIPMLVETTEQCPAGTYAKMEPITSAWYDCLLYHPYTCVPCSGNTSTLSDICTKFCNSATVGWLKADPGLRYARDVIITLFMTILVAFDLWLFIFLFLQGVNQLGRVRLVTLPIYGDLVEDKWSHVVSMIDAPFKGAFSRYNWSRSWFSGLLLWLSVFVALFVSLGEYYSSCAMSVILLRVLVTLVRNRTEQQTELHQPNDIRFPKVRKKHAQ
jgi:hypothetical protein